MVDILAFGAHPDDVDFTCGGLLAKMAALGHTIAIADLSDGGKGSNGSSEERRREGERAAAVVGAKRRYLDFVDGEIVDSYEGRLELVRVIREKRPKLVLAPLWKGEMNHPDHLACGTMARFACRYARFSKVLPELPPHKAEGILHYLFPAQQGPDFLVDVSDYLEPWKEMIRCHASQLKTNDYLGWNLRAASHWGVLIGAEYAVGLVKGNPIAVDDILALSNSAFEM